MAQASKFPQLYDKAWLEGQYATKSTLIIAAEIGCSDGLVLQALRRLGIPRHSLGMRAYVFPLYDREWLTAQYASNTDGQIAEMLVCSVQAVLKARKRFGIAGSTKRRDSLSLQDKAYWQELYATHTTTELAVLFDCHPESIRHMLMIHEIRRRRQGKVAGGDAATAQRWEDSQEEICEKYMAGTPMTHLAREYGVSTTAISLCLRHYGIPLRSINTRNTHCSLNHEAFDRITEASAYWAGFLMGDGHCHRDPPRLALSLAEKDRQHVYAFREFLSSSHRIWHHHIREQCGFSVRSAPLVAALETLGVTQEKSINGHATTLAMNRHWWRGCVDADGSLGIYPDRRGRGMGASIRLKLVGARPLVEQFMCFVRHYVPNCQAQVHQYIPNMWECHLSSMPARTVIALLYKKCTVFLPRKKHIADSIFDNQFLLPLWSYQAHLSPSQ